jgi:cytochrome c-type biogenesis protein CcmF
MLIVFVAYGIFDEFVRATYLRFKNKNENPLSAFLNLLKINRSRYGGYIIHLGFLVMVLGILGKAFELKTSESINLNDKNHHILIGPYKIFISNNHSIEKPDNITNKDLVKYLNQVEERSRFPYEELNDKTIIVDSPDRMNHFAQIINLIIIKDDNEQSMTVEKRLYTSPKFSVTKEIAIDSDLIKDIYIVLDRIDYNNNTVALTIWVNYLVNWVWIGTAIMLVGGLISLGIFGSSRNKKR